MKRITILIAFMLLIGFHLTAQVQITGTVTNASDGTAIPGVSVVVKENLSIGTTTNIDGKFTLNVPDNAETLLFSFIGMVSQEVAIEDQTVINVVMEEELLEIDEVVVTSYRTRKRDVVSSSVSIVGSETLETMVPSTSIDNMLQGKAAGVDATALNGKPGQTATIKIRGAISLNTTGGDKAQPLYVIDGVFLNEDELSGINPNDIASMTVLKDAAAAAIYGSRGANGVIIITTKQGKQGKSTIHFSSRFGTASKIKDPYDMMNTQQKIRYEEDYIETVYGIPDYFTPEEEADMLYYNHNWLDDILKTASIQSYSLSASGGNDNTTYFTSLGYDKNTGIIEKLNGFERISGRVNLNSQISDKLKIGTTTNVSRSRSDEPRDLNNVQNPFAAMYTYNPYIPVYEHDADRNLILDNNGDPIYSLTNQGFSVLEALEKNPEKEEFNRFIGSFFADYEIVEGLHAETKMAGSYSRYKREAYTQPGSILDGYIGDPAAPGSKQDNGDDTYDWTWLNKLSYSKTFGQNTINILAFNEYSEGGFHSYWLESKGYSSPLLTTQENSAEPEATITRRGEYSMWSMAGQADYDFDEKYLISASIRRDGASRFGQDSKYGVFWSASLGWNLAKESFFTLDMVDKAKFIVSYGTLGSWNIPNYASQGYYSFGSYGGQSSALIKTNIGNAELTWEAQKSFNAGLEFGLFENRLNGVVDYFVNTRSDFLFENPLGWEGGGYTQYDNAGEMQTKGLEFNLSGDIVRTQNFKWNVSANISLLDYTINELSGQEQIVVDGISILKKGEEPFTFYLPKYAGVDPDNGDPLYYDLDGNETNVFSSGYSQILSDKSPLAKTYGGFSTYLNFKGLDLNVDFSFKTGNYILNIMKYYMMNSDNWTSNLRTDALDYWQEPGDDKLPALGHSSHFTDQFLQDGSYLRLRNVVLGYALPGKWVSRIGIDRFRVFAQGQNLLTFTEYEGDPEISIGSSENQLGRNQTFVPGLYSLFSYPAIRTFTFGIDISF